MSTEVKKDSPEPVAVTEDGTNSIVHPGDAANKAVRVNLVAGAGPSGGPSSAFDATFPASGFGAGAKTSAAAPTYGEGNMVALSVDLTGALRTAGGASGGGLTDTQLRASPVPVSNASLPLPANAAIETGGHLASLDGKDFATQATLALIKAKTDNLDAALSTLATQATLAQIKTDVDKIPASPSQEHVTAGSPHAVELSDGAAFYTGAKTGQLPTALDGSGFLKVHEQGTAAISAVSLPLPTGAAKETGGNLDTIVARTPALGAATTANSTPVNIASDQVVAISATALPLPAGAATAAKQDTGNVSLASIDTKLTAYADGAVEGTGSGLLDMALCGDSPPVRIDGQVYPLSITNDGRLRVSTVVARVAVEFFTGAERQMWDANDDRYWGGYSPSWTHTGNPFTDW